MKKHFGQYYQPSSAELREIWTHAVIAIDANVLLNLYRYSSTLRSDLLSSLTKVHQQLFVPHQAMMEFFERRIGEMAKQVGRFDNATNELGEARRSLWGLYRAPVRERKDTQSKLNTAFDQLESYLSEARQSAIEPTADVASDPVLAQLTTLLEDRVGDPYPPEKLAELRTLGDQRFADRRPPGFKDADKPGDRRYGDLVLWFQLQDKARQAAAPIVLVTDDGKEDWWVSEGGKTIGPRPELVEEMTRETNQRFYIYKPPMFMKHVGGASEESIAEAEALPARSELVLPQLASYSTGAYIEHLRNRNERQRLIARRNLRRAAQHLAAEPDESRRPVIERQIAMFQRRLDAATREIEQIDLLERELRGPLVNAFGMSHGLVVGATGPSGLPNPQGLLTDFKWDESSFGTLRWPPERHWQLPPDATGPTAADEDNDEDLG